MNEIWSERQWDKDFFFLFKIKTKRHIFKAGSKNKKTVRGSDKPILIRIICLIYLVLFVFINLSKGIAAMTVDLILIFYNKRKDKFNPMLFWLELMCVYIPLKRMWITSLITTKPFTWRNPASDPASNYDYLINFIVVFVFISGFINMNRQSTITLNDIFLDLELILISTCRSWSVFNFECICGL